MTDIEKEPKTLDAQDSAKEVTQEIDSQDQDSDQILSPENDPFFDKFSPKRKRILVCLVAILCFLSPISTTMFLPLVKEIADEFNTTGTIINLSNACYCILMAISPCVTSPFADNYGRRVTFLVCILGYTIATALVSVSVDLAMFFVFRCVTALFGTAFFGVGASIIGDIFIPQQRGSAMGLIMVGSQTGLAIAGVIGGAIITYQDWRVIFYLLTLIGVVVFIPSFFLLPETLRKLKITEIRKETGKRFVWIGFNPINVVTAARYPVVLLASFVSCSIMYNMYCLLTPIRYVVDPRFNLNTPIYGSLFYLAPGMGYLVGSFAGGKWSDYFVRKYMAKRGFRRPEDRLRASIPFHGALIPISILVYGWCLKSGKGGMPVPIIFLFIGGFSQSVCFPLINAYCVDCIPQLNGDVIANNYFLRFLCAAILTGTVLTQIDHMGIGWTCTISAIVLWAGFACNLILILYGVQLRKKSFPQWFSKEL